MLPCGRQTGQTLFFLFMVASGGSVFWFYVYVAIAIINAAIAFLTAQWIRDRNTAAPNSPGVLAILAGLLWPITIVGAAQLLVIVAVKKAIRSTMSSREVSSEPQPEPERFTAM